MSGDEGARRRLESELRRALERAGATDQTIASVMGAGCRVEGVGAGAVSAELQDAGARLGRRIRALAGALDRLERGDYGRCEACGGAIDPGRLDLLPVATRCRSCADAGPESAPGGPGSGGPGSASGD